MNWAGLPSLNALRAFAAVAETGGFGRAGETLNVTHAAISQQIKALESRLGVKLVVREGRKINLTEEGVELAGDLAAGFASIMRGVDRLTKADAHRPVQVTMSPAFAVSWLMPRLVDFQKKHPEITLLLNPTAELVDPAPGGLDLAIRYKDMLGSKEPADVLMQFDLVVVGTPELIGNRKITHPKDLTALPWLQELGIDEVTTWLGRKNVVPTGPLMISHMPGNLIMEAVRRGDGITYTPRPLVDKELKSGRLVELFCDEQFGMFYLKTRPGPQRPPITAFIDWLKSQATGMV
ncbi:MAG: LysR substrate-binding domain-containing protein [Hyphomicrobiales bacterium]